MINYKSILVIGADHKDQSNLITYLNGNKLIGHFIDPFEQSIEEYLAKDEIKYSSILLKEETCRNNYVTNIVAAHASKTNVPLIIYGNQNDQYKLKQLYEIGITYYLYKFNGWINCFVMLNHFNDGYKMNSILDC